MILAPSLLAADFTRLGEETRALEKAGLSWAHWDVMDGSYVPNITLGAPIIKALRRESSLFFDVHLMIREPERHVERFADAGAQLLVFHVEACAHPHRCLAEIRRLGMKAGIALNPGTPLCFVANLLDELDLVCVMTVNPGFGGQKFLPAGYGKIRELAAMIQADGRQIMIEVDGGVSPENAALLVQAGADVLVTGSAFFAFPPYERRKQVFDEAAAAVSGAASV